MIPAIERIPVVNGNAVFVASPVFTDPACLPPEEELPDPEEDPDVRVVLVAGAFCAVVEDFFVFEEDFLFVDFLELVLVFFELLFVDPLFVVVCVVTLVPLVPSSFFSPYSPLIASWADEFFSTVATDSVTEGSL